MLVDDTRRLFEAASRDLGLQALLLSAEPKDGRLELRARAAAPWLDRRRLEDRLRDALGESADTVDLFWLPPETVAAPDARERAKLRLGIPTQPAGPGDVVPRPNPTPRAAAEARATSVRGVKKVIAVASGKGGVGKSTMAVNLALALKRLGLHTGLLDADIYGPSMPTMLGTFRAPRREGEIFTPPEGRGIPFLSLGLMVNPDQSVLWRGPMVQRLVADMMQKTRWPDLDVLVVDLPPGTGDVQITLCQRTLLDGAVIVTTPQDIALIDAARGLEMFRRLSVPVYGIVENMAEWACPGCGAVSHPFGERGGEREATRLGVPFLGRVPLDQRVREGGDEGVPIVDADPEGATTAAIVEVARGVARAMDEQAAAGGG